MIVILLTLIIFLAPLLYSGKTPESLLILEPLALLLLISALWTGSWFRQSTFLTKLFIVISLLIPLLYLLPLSLEAWLNLPGRDTFAHSIHWLQEHNLSPWLSASLVPYKTLQASIALWGLAGIFIATLGLNNKQIIKTVYVLFFVAAFQALWALIQQAGGAGSFFMLGMPGKSAQGFYLNRDHFVALMEMTLPLVIGLALFNLGRHNADERWSVLFNKSILYALLIILLLLAAIFTRSRAGIFIIFVGFILSFTLFARHVGGKQGLGIFATLTGLVIALSTTIGLVPILNRFIAKNPMEDERWRIFSTTIDGIQQFFPLGTGPGTFQEVYRTLQPTEQLGFVNHAHNDYLELLLETGAAGILILGILLILYILGWWHARKIEWDEYKIVKAASGISVLCLAIHSLVDFNMHTPANAIIFTFLLATFLQKPNNKVAHKKA